MMGRYLVAVICVVCTLAPALLRADPPPEIDPEYFTSPTQNEPPVEDEGVEIEPAFDGRANEHLSEVGPRDDLTLAELIGVALMNNPGTRYAWAAARAAAAGWGKSRSEYYPSIGAEVEGVVGKVSYPELNGGRSYVSVGLGLQYLLLDFGGREARVEAAKQALVAANWTHDQAIQDVMRNVSQAYHTYLGDRALVIAATENLRDAQTTLDATEARHASGVATISDVLQARSSTSQAQADLASSKGSEKIAKGNLATVVGWSANTQYGVVKDPARIPVKKMAGDVDKLVEEAKASRPDIGTAQAAVRQKMAELDQAKRLPFPKLSFTGALQHQQFRNSDTQAAYGSLKLEIPFFAGFSMRNAARQARAELEAAKAQLTQQQTSVIKDVWDSYHNFGTATEQYTAYQALLTSSQEAYNASLARYREGAADITELLNAQNTLASARAQLIGSRMNLFTSYAELMHAMGRTYSRNT